MIPLLALPLLPLSILAVVVGLRRSALLLAIYAAIVPWGSGHSLPLGLPDSLSTLSTLAGLVASGGIVAHLLATRRRSPVVLPSVALLVLFLAVAITTALWSIDLSRSLDQLLTLGSLIGLFAVSSLIAPDRRDLDRFEQGIVAGGVVAGLLAAFQLATDSLSTNAAGAPRFALAGGGGETSDPNITAAILLLPFIVAMARGLQPDTTRAVRLLWLGSGALVALAIALTASRGGLLAAFVALALLVREFRLGRRAVLALGAVGLVVVAVLTLGPSTLGERLTGEAGSTGRTMIWRIGLVACEEHCLTGAGWGTFAQLHEDILLHEPFASGREFRFEPHNAWLGTAVEGGVLSLLLLGGGIAAMALSLRRLPRHQRAAALTALGALVVSNTFLSNQDFKYFWLVLIYAAVVASSAEGRGPDLVPRSVVGEDAPRRTLEGIS